ncbi:MAG TPA: 3-dehydroquinate synthase II [Thermoplasmata archaeon]|nr:3-dehydroquinate synthase II [Thermoplasmata archaeon]
MTRARVVIAPTAAEGPVRRAVVDEALRRRFCRFLLSEIDELAASPASEVYVRSGGELLRRSGSGPERVPVIRVAGPADLALAVEAGRAAGAVAVRWGGDRVIPLENLLAEARGRFQIWAIVDRSRDLFGMLGALEHGAELVVLEVEQPGELERIEAALDPTDDLRITWELVPVRRTVPVGLGDRIIVDTTSLLAPEEGLLVGSAAEFLFHVASEAGGSGFTRPRPFRVNAGSAHSYVLMADGTTRYLSELSAGDTVAVVTPRGAQRAVRVGRLKIERRPLVLVEAERGDRAFTIFLQEAETVRLSGGETRIPATELLPGSKVYGAVFPPARHLGTAVTEHLEER